jgi:porin
VVAERYPDEFGAGVWYQTGGLHGPPGVLQNGTGGFYLFGGQRIWGRSTGSPAPDGKNAVSVDQGPQKASISTFVQFGLNNSETLPVEEYFGLAPHRPDDSLGVGMAWSWLNPSPFGRSNELMFQGYYQAHLYAGTFFQPALSYILNPGVNTKFDGAWALTFRFTFLF